MDTIFAEATPPGRGGVSVFRLSGPSARAALEALAGEIKTPRKAYLRNITEGSDLIDQALVLWFPEGESFTGEEVAELHLHGAPVIGNRLANALTRMGLRLAEAGEFTRRAFINGRIDLAEAEGLADLLSAETEAQRKLAMRTANGELGQAADALRDKLIRAGALVEASIDFADEEVPEEVPEEVFDLLADVRCTIADMLNTYPATERLRQGFEVAIVGPPNAGKSTLLNQIGQREIAIVSDIAGTTRDVLELRTDLRGLPVTFLDTAGLRESVDPIEMIGISQAERRSVEADLRIHLSTDLTVAGHFVEGDLVVGSKADLYSQDSLSLSAKTGKGVAEMLDLVYDRLKEKTVKSGLVSHKRQADALGKALDALDVSLDMAPEFLAEAIRQSATALSGMVGRVDAENFLDEIFSSFCIGK